MSLAKIRFTQKILKEKFGVKGIVAGRYLEAGYHVRIDYETSKGKVDVYAVKENNKYAIKVIDKNTNVAIDEVNEIYEKAKSINAKPLIILYGSGPKVPEDVLKKAQELGVNFRRMR